MEKGQMHGKGALVYPNNERYEVRGHACAQPDGPLITHASGATGRLPAWQAARVRRLHVCGWRAVRGRMDRRQGPRPGRLGLRERQPLRGRVGGRQDQRTGARLPRVCAHTALALPPCGLSRLCSGHRRARCGTQGAIGTRESGRMARCTGGAPTPTRRATGKLAPPRTGGREQPTAWAPQPPPHGLAPRPTLLRRQPAAISAYLGPRASHAPPLYCPAGTRAIGRMTGGTVRARSLTPLRTAGWPRSSKATGATAGCMATASTCTPTAASTKESGSTVRCTGAVCTPSRTATSMTASGRTTSRKATACCSTSTASGTKATGRTTRPTAREPSPTYTATSMSGTGMPPRSRRAARRTPHAARLVAPHT